MRTVGTALAGPDRQLTPAGTDLQQPGSRVHPAWSSSRSILRRCACASSPRLVRLIGTARPAVVVEQGRGVGHGLVEEQGEELVGQVVVSADVAARAVPGLVVNRRLPAHGHPAQPLQRRRHQVADVRGEDGQQAGQVRRIPLAGQVGLAEPDQAAGTEPGVESGWVVQHHDRRAERPGAEIPATGQPTRTGAGHGRPEQRAGDLPRAADPCTAATSGHRAGVDSRSWHAVCWSLDPLLRNTRAGRGTGRRPRAYNSTPCHRIRADTMAVDQGCRAAARSSAGLVAGTALPWTLAKKRCPSGRCRVTLQRQPLPGRGRLIWYPPSTGWYGET